MQQQYTSKHRVAVHEIGHALTAWSCTLITNIREVKINDKDGGGSTYFYLSDQETVGGMWCNLVITLAGLAAEIAAYGKCNSTGCKTDLLIAFKTAAKLEAANELIMPWKVAERKTNLPFHKMFVQLSAPQQSIMRQAYSMSHLILERYNPKYHRLVNLLTDKETISEAHLNNVLGGRGLIKFLGMAKPMFILPRQRAV